MPMMRTTAAGVSRRVDTYLSYGMVTKIPHNPENPHAIGKIVGMFLMDP